MKKIALGAGVLLAMGPVLIFVILVSFVTVLLEQGKQAQAGACGGAGQPGVAVDLNGLPTGPVAGYSEGQLRNAALVINAGKALGLSLQGQTIGVMTAMGESSLTVIDHGDAVGPDSRGLFQQRATGWGSYADRMDPTVSSTNFFTALRAVTGWETLPPTTAAHRVQRNADPNYYTPFWSRAQQVVGALAGTTVSSAAPMTAMPVAATPSSLFPGAPTTAPTVASAEPVSALLPCGQTPADGSVPAVGWTKPAIGAVTSGFGYRQNPTGSGGQMHNGQDIAPGCGAPIYAANAGHVVRAGHSSGYGNLIVIDHGAGVVTRYAHSYDQDVLVVVGQKVVAGQQIARVGSNGDSTGCHLHFEVQLLGQFTDPVPFLASHGVQL